MVNLKKLSNRELIKNLHDVKQYDIYLEIYNELLSRNLTPNEKANIAMPYRSTAENPHFYVFYSGVGYEHNSFEHILDYAKESIPDLNNYTDEEIKKEHFYWATDSSAYSAFYNGDSHIIFDKVDNLPKEMQPDAIRACHIEQEEELDR